ncbi:uncharacterized protein LOC123705905 [Colias croceus]|uniref:uncharacterized protein LOC123705905 n=1 Tax=Colias crocea TaxID=72248 RepID=UPI001E28099C|nr:uncharacterized protein LOC123705905 [Colias croceus]
MVNMANSYEDTVADFDLNFLQPAIQNVSIARIEKQRQSIINVKNKIIASHCLLKKFYLQKDKLDETESLLLASKEECKQACIDYKVTLEKCIQMEKDVVKLNECKKELEQKLNYLDNQCEAMRSHAHQLQLLVKEHESVIEALNIEKQLETSTVKDYQKKLASLEKEREEYLIDIAWMRDVILGKKNSKSCKDIINKYKDLKGLDNNLDSDNSCDESFLQDSPVGSPIHNQLQNKSEPMTFSDKIIKGAIFESGPINKIKELLNDNYYDCCNEEVISEDTGRGSSLAFSDADKFLNSPDLGFSTERHHNVINKENIIHVDAATSPIRIEEGFRSSPNIFDDEALLSDKNTGKSPEYFITDIPLSTEIVTIKEKRQLVDVGTSPIHRFTPVETSTSPIHLFTLVDTSTSPISFEVSSDSSKLETQILPTKEADISNNLHKQNVSVVCQKNINTQSSRKELEISTETLNCLEENNSKKICDEINNDCEVEMILRNMRLEHPLITPIPRTPAMSHKQLQKESNVLSLQSKTQDHVGCPDALKIREENKALQANISYLCKEIVQIKNILKTKMPVNFENVPNLSKESCQLFDECSQDTIILTNDITVSDDSRIESIPSNNLETNIDIQINCPSPPLNLAEQNPIYTDNLEHVTPPQQRVCKNTERNSLNFDETACHDHIDVIETSLINSDNEDNSQSDCLQDICDNNRKSCTSSTLKFQNDVCNTEIVTNNDCESQELEESHAIDSNNSRTINKTRKPTKLDRFKKKIMPRCKISGSNSPILRKLRKRNKLIPITNKEKIKKSLEILNNKEAYDKALKVMAELKSKKNIEPKKDFCKPNSKLMRTSDKKPKENITNDNEKSCESQENEIQVKQQERNSGKDLDKIRLDNTCDNNSFDGGKEPSKSWSNIKESVPDSMNQTKSISTRSRSRILANTAENKVKSDVVISDNKNQVDLKMQNTSRRRKRIDSGNSDVSCKRMLRSSNSEKTGRKELINNISHTIPESEQVNIDYSDLDLFSTNNEMLVEKENMHCDNMNLKESVDETNKLDKNTSINSPISKRRSLRLSSQNSDNTNKILLRSTNLESVKDNNIKVDISKSRNEQNVNVKDKQVTNPTFNASKSNNDNHIQQSNESSTINNPSNSILCKMIMKHGKAAFKSKSAKVTDTIADTICKKLENSISHILESQPDKMQSAITQFVEDMRKMNEKSLLAGLIKYLQDPARKLELYNKVNSNGPLAMTKREQIILSALQHLNTPEYNIVNNLLSNIEYTLFRLNHSPEFDTVESLSHFYAVTCKLFHMKYRLKTFILDAMYCLQYKAVALIKQCLTAWMHILPMAHMKYAKTPLITCIVYLLHFYKCEDKFNRVQDIRWILNKKYMYKFSEWNETKILEMFNSAIKSVKDDQSDRNMLRIALLIFAKRHGPKWCQKNVINNMLLPLIEAENTAEKVKIFCIEMLGPLLKPYPADMKVHCEIIVNQLLDMLDQGDLSHGIKEAIFTSLIYMSKHNPPRVTKALLSWQPDKISSELEILLKAYVREKPIKAWKTILSRIHM